MKLTIKQKGKEVAFAKIASSFGGYIELEKLVVEKQYRNQGLAKKLLGRIVSRYNKVVLIVEPLDYSTNKLDLIRLYSSFGFKFKKHDFGDCIKYAMVKS